MIFRRGRLAHDPKKWEPVFGKDHAQIIKHAAAAVAPGRHQEAVVVRFHGISFSSRTMGQKPLTPAKTSPAPIKADSA
jgi:hypothetical protein